MYRMITNGDAFVAQRLLLYMLLYNFEHYIGDGQRVDEMEL